MNTDAYFRIEDFATAGSPTSKTLISDLIDKPSYVFLETPPISCKRIAVLTSIRPYISGQND